jgi:NarL family two-component system response regulator YdfI
MIRTVVSASSELARLGLAAIVRGDARLRLIGETAPRDLGRLVEALGPDVVLEQREHAGEALRAPSVALVDDPGAAWDSERLEGGLGARALLARDATPEEIVAAIVAVAAGLIALQPRAVAVPSFGSALGTKQRAAPERLTARERSVLAELARGAPNKTIAGRLAISEHTVKFHVASIFAKLGVASRTEAVAQGARLGLIML